MKSILSLIIIFTTISVGQVLEFNSEIGKFSGASSFDIDLNGNIYVTDIQNNNLTKLDSNGEMIVSIGGYGWSEESFDEPVDVISNTLSVYVADKNNDRVQRFDKDLNFLSLYSGSDNNSGIEFAYPTAVEISNIGDLYILESDNNRILKFNLTGEYLSEIGGNDAGIFALSNPKDFAIDKFGNLFVIDENMIKIFDQYGTGQSMIEFSFTPNKITLNENFLALPEKNQIHFFNRKGKRVTDKFNDPDNIDENLIVDLKFTDKYLYVLLSDKLLKYKIILN